MKTIGEVETKEYHCSVTLIDGERKQQDGARMPGMGLAQRELRIEKKVWR